MNGLAEAIERHRAAKARYDDDADLEGMAFKQRDAISNERGTIESDAMEAVFLYAVKTPAELRMKIDYLASLPENWIDGSWLESWGRWPKFLASLSGVRDEALFKIENLGDAYTEIKILHLLFGLYHNANDEGEPGYMSEQEALLITFEERLQLVYKSVTAAVYGKEAPPAAA